VTLRSGALGVGSPVIVSFDEHPPVLRCSGDEDRSTQSRRRRALSQALRARADVTVDLKDLGFADASLMLDLAMLARRLRKVDRSLHLQGAQPQIHVLIEYVGLHRLEGVRVQPEPTPA
jgi:ABC-type transporter Mla MlaB component